MSKTVPDHAPLLAADLICYGCGNILKAKPVFKPSGNVDYLLYQCRDEKSGCSYEIRSTVFAQHIEMKPIRQDGSLAVIPQ